MADTPYSVDKLTAEARRLAADYRRATGKTLPLSGEIAVNDAIRLLGLQAPADSQATWDAEYAGDDRVERVQIKGRVVFDENRGSQRLGQLGLDHPWDCILVVLMDADYEPTEIFRASREAVAAALKERPGTKRGAMSIARFKRLGARIWARDGDDLDAPRNATA